MIAIVILAAGAAKRMGTPKQLLPLDERPIIWWVAKSACQSGANKVILVAGAHCDQVRPAVADLPVTVVYNSSWEDGQASSVITGIQSLHPDTEAVIFIPADQPFVNQELFNQLICLYRTKQGSIVVPEYSGQTGTPVLFDYHKWRTVFLTLSGDQGARQLIKNYPEEVIRMTVTDQFLLKDIDTPEDYEQAKIIWTGRQRGDK